MPFDEVEDWLPEHELTLLLEATADSLLRLNET